jgi:ABC-type transporter Mla subunit MlaD
MEYFRPDVKVGAFIFVTLVLLVAAAIVVGGVRDWFITKQEYTVLLPNANLLRRRAKVSYAGSPVGEVSAITVHTDEVWKQQHPKYPVAVTIVVRGAVLLRKDASAELRTEGFIGERYLDIAPGSGDPLPPGGVIVGSIGGVEGIIASLSGFGSGFGELSEQLRGLLGDVSEDHSLAMAIRNLRQLLEELRPHLLELTVTLNDFLLSAKQDIGSTSVRAGRTLEGVDRAVAETSTELKRLMRELHTSLGEVKKTMVAAQQTLATAKTLLNTTQGDMTRLLVSLRDLSGNLQRSTEETLAGLQRTLAHVDEVVAHNDRNLYMTVEHLRDAAADLKATTRQVRMNPSVLLWGSGGQQESDARSTSDATMRALQDRGRVGRYDKLQ